MGSDLTVFLEFYGLPGCGKSTVSHLVAEELRKQGKKVIEPTYDSDHKYSGSKRKAVKLLKLVQFAVRYPERYKRLMRLIKDNGYRGSELVSQAANITAKLWIYEKAKEDYVIFDEGLTQSAISLCQGKRSAVDNEAALYGLCKERTVRKIYIKVEAETALERMAGRDRHDSRIEKIEDAGEQREALRAFEEQCEGISAGFAIGSDSKDETVNVLLNWLQEMEADNRQ